MSAVYSAMLLVAGPMNRLTSFAVRPSLRMTTPMPLGPMSVGQKIADAVIILGSIDIVLGETDR